MSTLARTLPALVLLALPLAVARAGDIRSNFAGDRLILNGSPGDDVFTITKLESGAQDLLVTPGEGHTINGGTDAVPFLEVGEIRIFLLGGHNQVSLEDVFLPRTLNVQGGSGVDQVILIDCSFLDDFIAALRQGDDRIQATNLDVFSTLRFTGSTGDDELNMSISSIDDLDVDLGPGENEVSINSTQFDEISARYGAEIGEDPQSRFELTNCDIEDDVKLTFGNVRALVFLNTIEIGGDLRVRLSGRDDLVTTFNLEVGDDVDLIMGGGDNQASLNDAIVGGLVDYRGGSREDLLNLGDCNLGAIEVRMPGQDQGQVNLGANGVIQGRFEFIGGGADNVLNLAFADFGSVKVSSGGGDDVINVSSAVITGSLTVFSGSGDDTVNDNDTTVGGSTSINLGSGEG